MQTWLLLVLLSLLFLTAAQFLISVPALAVTLTVIKSRLLWPGCSVMEFVHVTVFGPLIG